MLPSPTPPGGVGGLVEDRFPELGTKKAKRRKKKSSLISKEDLLKEMELQIDDVGDDNLSAWQQGQQRTLRNAHAALHSPIGTKHSAQLRREQAVRTELKRLRPHVRAHHRSGHRGKVREAPATPVRKRVPVRPGDHVCVSPECRAPSSGWGGSPLSHVTVGTVSVELGASVLVEFHDRRIWLTKEEVVHTEREPARDSPVFDNMSSPKRDELDETPQKKPRDERMDAVEAVLRGEEELTPVVEEGAGEGEEAPGRNRLTTKQISSFHWSSKGPERRMQSKPWQQSGNPRERKRREQDKQKEDEMKQEQEKAKRKEAARRRERARAQEEEERARQEAEEGRRREESRAAEERALRAEQQRQMSRLEASVSLIRQELRIPEQRAPTHLAVLKRAVQILGMESEDSRGLAQELPFCAPSLELSRQPLDVQADRVVARIREGQAERKAALQAQADALQAELEERRALLSADRKRREAEAEEQRKRVAAGEAKAKQWEEFAAGVKRADPPQQEPIRKTVMRSRFDRL